MPEDYLDIAGVAEMLGVSPSTLRAYRSRGRMPAPDVMVGTTPGWLRATITDWNASRRGQGWRDTWLAAHEQKLGRALTVPERAKLRALRERIVAESRQEKGKQ